MRRWCAEGIPCKLLTRWHAILRNRAAGLSLAMGELNTRLQELAGVGLRVISPNALRPIEDLIAILYPGARLSYGTIQSIAAEAEAQAAAFNVRPTSRIARLRLAPFLSVATFLSPHIIWTTCRTMLNKRWPKKEVLFAVHDSDLEGLLSRLNLLSGLSESQYYCHACGETLTIANLGGLFKNDQGILLFCDKAHCVDAAMLLSQANQ